MKLWHVVPTFRCELRLNTSPVLPHTLCLIHVRTLWMMYIYFCLCLVYQYLSGFKRVEKIFEQVEFKAEHF